jgi:hypothetical protein
LPEGAATALLLKLDEEFPFPNGLEHVRTFAADLTRLYADASAEARSWPWEKFGNIRLLQFLIAQERARRNAFELLASLGGEWANTREGHVVMPEVLFEDIPQPDDECAGQVVRLMSFPRRFCYLWFLKGSPTQHLRHDLQVHASRQLAVREIARRLQLHRPGASCALLLISQQWLFLDRHSGWLENAQEDYLSTLGRMVWGHVPKWVVHGLGESFSDRTRAIDSQIWETLCRRLKRRHRYLVMLDALKGRLDVMPKAVANRLTDRGRAANRRVKREEIVVRLEVREESAVVEPPVRLDAEDLLKDFARRNPKQRRAVLAATKPTPSRAELGRLADLRKALGGGVLKKGRPRTKK